MDGTSRYPRLASLAKESDRALPRMIGRIGSTGKSTGPHLHFEFPAPAKPDDSGDPDED